MNTIEQKFLILFLESILINQLDSSCNDLILPQNTTTLDFMEFFNSKMPIESQLSIMNDQIVGLDIEVTRYFINVLKNN
jgi:hypothetical protein